MRKALRIFGIFVLSIILIHLIVVVYIWINNKSYLERVKLENVEYLKANSTTVSQTEIDDEFFEAALDDTFYDSNIFLLGESHGFADVQNIDFALLKHLNKKEGVRFYIAEMDKELGAKLNKYLTDSIENKELLAEVVFSLKSRIPQQASKELFKKWESVRAYNLTLPDSVRINVLGIDKDYDDSSTQVPRDSMMVKNLAEAVADYDLQGEKFYGLFGHFHVMQEPVGNSSAAPFGARLKRSNLDFLNRVSSLVVYHIDSEVYFPENEQFPTPGDEKIGFLNNDGPITLVKGINDLEAISGPNTVTLSVLNKATSPYRKSQALAGIKVNFFGNDLLPKSPGAATTDCFQYVILGRNSEALTKY